MKRNHKITIRLTKEELDILNKKSEESGMQVSSMLRFLGLKSNIVVTKED